MSSVFQLGEGCDLSVFQIGPEIIKLFPLEDDETGPDIQVYIPGPPGPNGGIIDLGSRSEPSQISGTLPAQIYQRQRIFIQGSGGPSVDPSIPNGQGTFELCLFGTSDANPVILNGAANLQLSGQWIGGNGSILKLIWDNDSQYVEDYRNEI